MVHGRGGDEMKNWKDVLGYEGIYQVSNYGDIRSLHRLVRGKDGRLSPVASKMLKWHVGAVTERHPRPMYSVELWRDNKRKRVPVHRIVAMAFIPNHHNYPQVNHIDGNRKNNSADNLEWCTASENNYHAYRMGLRNSGMSKAVIGYSVRSGIVIECESIAEAARLVNGNPDAIRGAVKGRLKTSSGFRWQFKD